MTRHNEERGTVTRHEISGLGLLLIGIGIGLLTGLFIAPRSGAEMREGIRRRSHEGLDYLNEQAERVRDDAEAAITKGKEWIGRKAEAVQSVAETRRPFHEPL
ncbi:MAG: YtxH domain-containing protein [Candidatus Binatia bacterium]